MHINAELGIVKIKKYAKIKKKDTVAKINNKIKNSCKIK